MRYNNVYAKNNDITLVVPASILTTEIQIFKYVPGLDIVALTYTSSTSFGYRFINVPGIDEDCYVLANLGDNSDFIRVGNPPPAVLARYNNLIGNTMNYTQHSFNGETLRTGNMLFLTNQLYSIPVITVQRSFFNILGNLITITLPDKFKSQSEFSNGNIWLERGVWQLIAIPEPGTVKEIFIDRLAAQEGVLATELFEVVSAYPGHINKFLTYVPGFTDINSEHNFQLVHDDNGSVEITAFWVKCKPWTHKTGNILYTWNNIKL